MSALLPEGLDLLSATDAARAVRDGACSAEMLVQACLDRIAQTEDAVRAWAFLDPAHALAQARALDEQRRAGGPVGPLHGVPVGIKDIIDTRDMPTEDGTVLHAGRTPDNDAAVVRMLRSAGAVIMGKTVTTELATYAPGVTRNPHDTSRTPGGSSSGSAAAVAAAMVPLAIGTQTNGSVIRPAAYCGVVGFKPTHGLVPRTGILQQSRPLDTVGVLARSVEDVALAISVIAGHDENDPDTRPRARPPFVSVAGEDPPLRPSLVFVRTPVWDRVEPGTAEAFEELLGFLGDRIEERTLPDHVRDAWEWHRTIMESDIALSFEREYDQGADRLSASLRTQIERGRGHLAVDYLRALRRVPALNAGFDDVFDRYDAIVTPAAAGVAPRGLDSTGDPAFCTLWTLCGMPAITLPLMRGEDGMPLGVQLVGRRGDDARLLRTARWLARRVAGETD